MHCTAWDITRDLHPFSIRSVAVFTVSLIVTCLLSAASKNVVGNLSQACQWSSFFMRLASMR